MEKETDLTLDLTQSSTINVSPNLKVSINDESPLPEVPENIIYPNELNTFLREQLRVYMHKNAMLEKNLNELEERYSLCKDNVSKLELKLSDYENICEKTKISTSSQLISSKIVELSKKLREKNSETESLRTKYSKLEKQAYELKIQLENDLQKPEKSQVNDTTNSLDSNEIKKYNEKVSYLTSKVTEAKNLNIQLKRELTLAKKLLEKEVGDNFDNLQVVYNANTAGWRGRAQIICDLQKKNADLKEKLKLAHDKNPPVVIPQLPLKIESQLNELSSENANLKQKVEEFKKKYETTKARLQVLEMENNMGKTKISALKEQALKDQETISQLTKQISIAKESRDEDLFQKEQSLIKFQNEKDQMLQEMEVYKNVISDLHKEISSLNNKIRQVKKTEDKMEDVNLSTERWTAKNLEDKETATDFIYQDVEEVIENMNRRLLLEREKNSKTQSLLRLEKQKLTKAEAVIAKIELENYCSLDRSNYTTTTFSKTFEPNLRDRLEIAEESLKAMQTRLEIEQLERKADLQTFSKILKKYGIKLPKEDF